MSYFLIFLFLVFVYSRAREDGKRKEIFLLFKNKREEFIAEVLHSPTREKDPSLGMTTYGFAKKSFLESEIWKGLRN